MKKQHQNKLNLNRRNILKFAGFMGVGLVIKKVFTPQTTEAQLPNTSVSIIEINPNQSQDINWHQFNYEIVQIDKKGKIINKTQKQNQSFLEVLPTGINLEMVLIPSGSFIMGSKDTELGNVTGSESPQHQVNLSSFSIGKYPITQAQWRAIASLPKINLELNPNPSYFKGDNLPVERVSWYETVEFCARLSRYTGRKYRLPSEAEWEYACRAGTETPFYYGETIISDLANYFAAYDPYPDAPNGEYRAKTTSVGKFPPNAFGLYDLHGNVAEWCADLWHKNYKGAFTNAQPWLEQDKRVHRRYRDFRTIRGGSWGDDAGNCRTANRTFCDPNQKYSVIGFRVVLFLG